MKRARRETKGRSDVTGFPGVASFSPSDRAKSSEITRLTVSSRSLWGERQRERERERERERGKKEKEKRRIFPSDRAPLSFLR